MDMSCGYAFATIFPATNQTSLKGTITFKSLRATLNFSGRPLITEIRLTNVQENMQNLTINNCGLSATALNALFGDLPTITNGSVLSIIGNPGVVGCDTSIAKKKGWTVVTV